MDDVKKAPEVPTFGAVDMSAMMASSVVQAIQNSQGGMMDVGLTLAALSKASAMVLGSMSDKGARLALVQKYRVQVGLDTAEVAEMIAARPEDDRPVTVDVNALGGVN